MAVTKGHGPRRGTFRGAIDGAKIWWVAPTYPTANEIIWPDLKRALAGAWVDKSETEHYIELPGGGSVAVKSADNPDSLRGAGLDGLVFDEAAFAKPHVWTEVLRPMLTDRQGWAMFLTTPNGCNWFFKLFREANAEGWQRWQRPTRENPLITPEELETVRNSAETGPRTFAQEFEAKFTEEEGAYFPVEYFPDSMWFDEWPREDTVALRCIACDPSVGKSELSDYSAIVMLMRTIDCDYVMADLERRPAAKTIIDCVHCCRQFRASIIGFETNGFQSLLKDEFDAAIMRHRCEVETVGINNGSDMAKKKRLLRLDAPLSQHRIKFLRGHLGTEMLVDQLRGFPLEKYHDDGPDALEMAMRIADAELAGAIRRYGDEWQVTA